MAATNIFGASPSSVFSPFFAQLSWLDSGVGATSSQCILLEVCAFQSIDLYDCPLPVPLTCATPVPLTVDHARYVAREDVLRGLLLHGIDVNAIDNKVHPSLNLDQPHFLIFLFVIGLKGPDASVAGCPVWLGESGSSST